MEGTSTSLDWPTDDNYKQPMLNNNVQRPTLHNMNKHHHNSSQQQQIEHNLSLKSSGSRDQQIFRRALSRSSTGSTPPPSNNSTSFSTRGSSSANMNVSSTTNNNNNNGRGGIIFESYESSVNTDNQYDGGGRNNNSSVSIPSRDLGNSSSQNNRSILDNIAESVAQRQQTSQLNAAQLRALNNSNLTNTPTSQQQQNTLQQNQSLAKSFGTPSPSNTSHKQLSPPQSTTTKPRSTVNKLVSMFSLKHEKELAKKNSSASSIPLSSEEKRIAANSVKSRASGWENRARNDEKKSIGVGSGLQYIKQTVAGVQFQSPIITTNTNRQQQQQTQRNQGGSVTNSSTQSQSTYSTTGGGPYIQSNHNPNSTNFNPPQHYHNHQQQQIQSQQPLSISPSRSNTQSSVTEYTGESSNYNPTGWPGTIDRRGRMYAMERSYSESENESTSSPLKHMNQRHEEYPIQNYRDNEPQHFNNNNRRKLWLNDECMPSSHGPIDLDGAYNTNNINTTINPDERRSGPIDLDEAYENRFDDRKSAADVQLDAALQMRNNPSQRQTSSSARQANNTTMNSQTTRDRFEQSQTTNAMLEQDAKLQGIDLTGSEHRVRASGRQLPSPKIFQEEVSFDTDPVHDNAYNNNNSYSSQQQHQQQRNQPQTLSEEALRYKDSQSAPPREGGNLMLRGYRGFIDKTKDVPNLMDDLESEASTNIFSTADVRRHANMGLTLPSMSQQQQRSNSRQTSLGSIVSSNIESESDVFDGVVQEEPFGLSEEQYSLWERSQDAPQAIQQHASYNFEDEEQINFSTQYNPFTTTSKPQHNSRAQSNSFMDPTLDISAVTRGSADISSHHLHHDMDGEDEDFESLPDLSIYYVQPEMVRKMVRAFRKLCTSQMEFSSSEESMLYDFENLVDTKKAFALFEMRSRIMETDIDRGLERRGGTNVVDDIVLTPYFQAASRVRDAVIVSKAWRDGATPKDVTTAHLLTRRSAKAHFVKRPIRRIKRPGMLYYDSNVPQYWLEEVKWLDDTDFQQMRCQSLGAGTMSGFEMFTIGDCQSILLRLTSENCTQLRRELKVAMLHSIEAEELMQEEIDLDGDENIVLEAEQLFRDATIDVKRLSVKLVLADKAFALVRNRMEKLVETIESLLVQIEDEDDDGGESTSSSVQSEDEDFDEDNSYASQDSEDREELVQRAKRAELSAEVAVRETLMARQQAEQMQFDKQREIDELKTKLSEMETKSQLMAAENRKLYYGSQVSASFFLDDAKSFLGSTFDKEAEETRKQKLKSKFKQRRNPKVIEATPQRKTAVRDEEIYSHHDFYTRALNAVNRT